MNATKINAALNRINGKIIRDSIVYFDNSTRKYYVGPVADLDDLCELMASDDKDVSRSAYSHWCAGTSHAEYDTEMDAEEAANQSVTHTLINQNETNKTK